MHHLVAKKELISQSPI